MPGCKLEHVSKCARPFCGLGVALRPRLRLDPGATRVFVFLFPLFVMPQHTSRELRAHFYAHTVPFSLPIVCSTHARLTMGILLVPSYRHLPALRVGKWE